MQAVVFFRPFFILLMVIATVKALASSSSSCPSSSKKRLWGAVEEIRPGIVRLFMNDDGTYPNNVHYPTLLFRNAYKGSQQQEGSNILIKKGWTSPWVWGIFGFHHYHSNAWEILICIKGEATVQLGGPTGPIVTIHMGDVTLIPPGFAHKQVTQKDNFTLLGAYPIESPNADTIRGEPTSQQRLNIQDCYVPLIEPITQYQLKDLF